MTPRTPEVTVNGLPLPEEAIEALAAEALRGYSPEPLAEHRRGRGRPPLGAAKKKAGSIRLSPELRAKAITRAELDCVTVSEVVRRALQEYLERE